VIAPGRVGMIRMFWGKHPEAGLRGNIRLIRCGRARICLTPAKTRHTFRRATTWLGRWALVFLPGARPN
jgi:hypothetical protein